MDQIPKRLVEMKGKLPFKVPQNYFDDFPVRMQLRLEAEGVEFQKKQPGKIKALNIIKPVLGLVAGFAAAFVLVYWPVKNISQDYQKENVEIAQESNDLIMNIIEWMDANTFYAILENGNNEDEPVNDDVLIEYLAMNYSDYDIYLETQK
ncbi:MAG: hypothetical protein FWG22_02050 [Prolixibacteraceae bacterium]|nr:hypothetical protein [Prolixibacteraceae bacterium]